MFPLLDQFLYLTLHFQYIWLWFGVISFAINGSLWDGFFSQFCHVRLSSEFWEEVPVLFLKTLPRTTFSTFVLGSMNHGWFSHILVHLGSFGFVCGCAGENILLLKAKSKTKNSANDSTLFRFCNIGSWTKVLFLQTFCFPLTGIYLANFNFT